MKKSIRGAVLLTILASYAQAQNVGIGITNPTERLSVNGNILLPVGSSLYVGGVTNNGQTGSRFHNNGAGTFIDNKGAGSIFFRNDNDGGGTIRMELTNDGRVGIGTGGAGVSNAAVLHLNSETKGLLLPVIASHYPLELADPTPGMIFFSRVDSSYKVAVPLLTSSTITQVSNGSNAEVGSFLRDCSQAATTYAIAQSGVITKVQFSVINVSNAGSAVAELVLGDNPVGGTVIGSLAFNPAAGVNYFIVSNTRINAGQAITVRFRSFDARFTLGTGSSDASRSRWSNVTGSCSNWATTGWSQVPGNPITLIISMEGATRRVWGNLLNSAGRVGIGIDNPRAPLHVTGAGNNTTSTSIRYFNYATTGVDQAVGWQGAATIFAEGNICASEAFIASQNFNFSDARIKQIVGLSNNEQDLERLRKIEVTRYRYIDTMSSSSAVQTKVIAQQLKTVMPEAVSYRSQFIPSIMQLATTSSYDANKGELSLTATKLPELEANVPIKCYAENGTELHYTLVAANGQTLILKGPAANGRLFVYGHEVKDFHVVDYDAIGMLNVSATQALLQRIEALEAMVKKLQKQ